MFKCVCRCCRLGGPYQYAPYQHVASIIAAQLLVETAVRGGKRWSGWGDELSTFEETDWGILDQANFTWTLKLDAPQDVVSAALDLMGGWDQIYGEHVATGGAGMNADKLGRLATFHRRLRGGLVLEFDPALPPEPDVSNQGGWRYLPREAADGYLLIRVNEHTMLTDEGRRIWRLPAVEVL